MKCPKCGYLGFETGDRCRNCGYDFSLASPPQPTTELPLNVRDTSAGPLADLDLGARELRESAPALDLDRMIGGSPTPTDMTEIVKERNAGPMVVARAAAAAASTTAAATQAATRQVSASSSPSGLPLFSPRTAEADDAPLITKPRPVRAPLSVRRATPDVPRLRPRPVRPRQDDAALNLQTDEAELDHQDDREDQASGIDVAAPPRDSLGMHVQASGIARFGAMLVDTAVLGGINAAIVYLTLAMTGLAAIGDLTLPAILVPLVSFLLLLNAGYLITFTAAGGQTIGKMLTGIRVIGDDGGRVDIGSAVLRAGGCLASLLTAGLGYIPAFFTADGRALQDRLAGTRVVRNR